jgi:hypothetical protein
MRLGGSDVEFRRLRSNAGLSIDPTAKPRPRAHDDLLEAIPWQSQGEQTSERFSNFFRGMVAWLIRYREELTDDACEEILDWALHVQTESERLGESFSFRGRTLAGVLDDLIEYRRLRNTPTYPCIRWNSHELDWTFQVEVSGEAWTFKELTSGRELWEEGARMHHCVSSYAFQCAAGSSAIVSVSVEGHKAMTIEINPATDGIVQVRGPCNRPTTWEQNLVVEKWRAAIRLRRTKREPE